MRKPRLPPDVLKKLGNWLQREWPVDPVIPADFVELLKRLDAQQQQPKETAA